MVAVCHLGCVFLIIAIRDSDPLVFWSSIAWLLGVISFAVSRWGPRSGR